LCADEVRHESGEQQAQDRSCDPHSAGFYQVRRSVRLQPDRHVRHTSCPPSLGAEARRAKAAGAALLDILGEQG
jgi:hypothetical protein